MDFKYLYNPDNGICHPYTAAVAENRSDLVPLLADELNLIRTMSVADIIARRARLAAPTASVSVETDNVPSDPTNAQKAISADHATNAEKSAVPKGVVVVGKVEKPKVDEFQFEDKPKDYKGYCVYGGDIFPAEELQSVPDTELVRFAREVLKRTYEDAPAVATDVERAEYYLALREKIARTLTRINRKRIEKRIKKESENG